MMPRSHKPSPPIGRPRRTALLIAALAVPLVVVGGAGIVLAASQPPAAPNPNCSLIVPADPLSAKGLATPYQLVATHLPQGGCHESNDAQAPFLEAARLNPAPPAGRVYHSRVRDPSTPPASLPAHPALRR